MDKRVPPMEAEGAVMASMVTHKAKSVKITLFVAK